MNICRTSVYLCSMIDSSSLFSLDYGISFLISQNCEIFYSFHYFYSFYLFLILLIIFLSY